MHVASVAYADVQSDGDVVYVVAVNLRQRAAVNCRTRGRIVVSAVNVSTVASQVRIDADLLILMISRGGIDWCLTSRGLTSIVLLLLLLHGNLRSSGCSSSLLIRGLSL